MHPCGDFQHQKISDSPVTDTTCQVNGDAFPLDKEMAHLYMSRFKCTQQYLKYMGNRFSVEWLYFSGAFYLVPWTSLF